MLYNSTKLRWLTGIILLMLIALQSQARNSKAYIGLESRWFAEEAREPEQKDFYSSVSAQWEYYKDFDDGDQRFVANLFGRIDSSETGRSHGDIQELYWRWTLGNHELYVGQRKVFWGVAESVHLVDIINQTNLLENIDREQKLGQAMLQWVYSGDYGSLEFFFLPYFREQKFIEKEGRLRSAVAISDDALYESSKEERHRDIALRWSHYFGPIDIGLSYFNGTARDPIFTPSIDTSTSELILHPFYRQIEQYGLDVQATIEAWLWKLEAISVNENTLNDYLATVAGVEYTLYSVFESAADIGIVMEYQYDDRNDALQTVSQNDIAMGARWAFNDLDGSELLVLYSQDLDNDNKFVSFELQRRLNDHWKVNAELRAFVDIDTRSIEYDLRDDDYLQIEVRRFF